MFVKGRYLDVAKMREVHGQLEGLVLLALAGLGLFVHEVTALPAWRFEKLSCLVF